MYQMDLIPRPVRPLSEYEKLQRRLAADVYRDTGLTILYRTPRQQLRQLDLIIATQEFAQRQEEEAAAQAAFLSAQLPLELT
jgi:hypothetical protein